MSGAQEVLEAVRAGCARAPASGRPEAVLREHVQPALEEALASRGLRSSSRDEFHLAVPNEAEAAVLDAPLATSGRIDAVYNRFVIEFEPPGSLRTSVMHSATRHAVAQVQQYLRGLSEADHLPIDRLAGCAFDGSWIVYVIHDLGQWRVTRPRPVDLASLEGMLETLQSLASGRGLTADNLYEDFGPDSSVAAAIVPLLANVFSQKDAPPRAAAFFEQWRLDLGNASGLPSTMDIPDWVELCDSLGVSPDDAKRPQVLFALQTYFGIIAKLVSLVVLEGATGQPLLTRLSSDADVWAAYEALESGHLTSSIGALNAIEPGIFSWYLAAESDELGEALRKAARVAGEYSAEVIEVTPIAARDVMKHLFQRLLPRSLRHRLGEYYTPDWLAEFLLDQLGYEGDPRKTLLDPACGSGTFLVAAISRIRAWYEENRSSSGLSQDDLLQAILIAVTGFDLSPLAVMAARTNYLIAIRDLLRTAKGVEIPVYLCDSILAPNEYGDLFTGGHGRVLELKTSVGSFLVPVEVAHNRRFMASFADVLQQSISAGDSFAKFVDALRQQGIPVRDESAYEDLFTHVGKLATEDIDGIWAHIISNSFAAAMQHRVDFVVGNPPWVFWNTLPTPYRDDIKDVMVNTYKLASGSESTMRQLGSAGKDISALFVYVSLDRYLADGGKLGFVITQTLFQSTASAEFRRWRLPDDVPIRIASVDDWVEVAPFTSATNKTATFVAVKGEPTEYPVKYRVWRPTAPFDRDKATLEEVRSKVAMEDKWAHPADSDIEGSLWVISESHIPHDRPVQTGAYRVRRGAETGLESAYRVRPIGEIRDDVVLVENIRDRARVPVPHIEAEVEIARLFPYVSGASIKKWLATSPGSYVVPHTRESGMTPLTERIMRDHYPRSLDFLSNFRELLERRPIHQRWGRANPYFSLYVIGPYTFADWKVVWKRTTRNFEAAVVSVLPVLDDVVGTVIPNGKVMMIPFSEPAEAHYVCGVLNSCLSRARINAAISSEAHSQVLDLIELPPFDPANELQRGISDAAAVCGELAEQGSPDLLSAEEKVDSLVGVLWRVPPSDVDAAREAVAPKPRRIGRARRQSS